MLNINLNFQMVYVNRCYFVNSIVSIHIQFLALSSRPTIYTLGLDSYKNDIY